MSTSIQTDYYNNYEFKSRSIHKLIILSVVVLLFLIIILFVTYIYYHIKRKERKKREVEQLELINKELNKSYNNELEYYENIDSDYSNLDTFSNDLELNDYFNNKTKKNKLSLRISNSNSKLESEFI